MTHKARIAVMLGLASIPFWFAMPYLVAALVVLYG